MTNASQQDLLYFGTVMPSSPMQLLSVGLLSVEFVDGGLRNIRYAGHEILRAISYVVRDKDWGTYAPNFSNIQLSQNADTFRIRYEASCSDPNGQALEYTVEIIGNCAGTLQFEAKSTTLTDFLTCRNGFCVLHPINGVAGEAAQITHTDGTHETSVFPALIAPWQPFMDIKAITHQVAGGLQVTCQFEGDVFEMEDQRNWSDSSYKTYVRPLARPWPYLIPKGETSAQSVSITLQGDLAKIPPPSSLLLAQTVITLSKSTARLPKIGIAIAPEEIALNLENIGLIRAIGPQIILCHFDPTIGHGTEVLSGFAAIARQYNAEYILECVLPGVDDPSIELKAIAAQITASGFAPDGIAVCPSVDRQSVPPGSPWPPCPSFEHIYQAARDAFPELRLGGGMFSYFTELNRKRPPFEQLDWVTHNTNPIVHAADDLSVMQTLEALPHITRSCRTMIGADKPYWIGPVTIGMRQNPYGSRTMPNPEHKRIPMADSDPRQRGLFGAAWLLGYAASIADADLEVLTLGQLMGPRGFSESILPIEHRDHAKSVHHPAFHIVAGLAKMAQTTLIKCDSSHPDQLLALAGIDQQGQTSIWIANLSGSNQTCRFEGDIPTSPHEVFVLDERNPGKLDQLTPKVSTSADAENGLFMLDLQPYSCVNILWPANSIVD